MYIIYTYYLYIIYICVMICVYFPRDWRYRMAASRGVKLVGMSTMSLDTCHFSLLIKKKK